MYAIAYKIAPHSSWLMFSQVYEDREKCDVAVSALLRGELLLMGKVYKAQRVFWEPEL